MAGALEYHRADGERLGLAAVHGWLAKAESGWEYTLRALDRYYERVLSLAAEGRKFSPAGKPLIQLVRQEFPAEVPELVGTYLESARLLGLRTAELHLALAAEPDEPGVCPGTLHDLLPAQPVSVHAQQRQAQPAETAGWAVPACRRTTRPLASRVLEREPEILKRFHVAAGAAGQRGADSLSWGLRAGAGAAHRQGLHDCGF